jgi:PAS domain S-box-containing protein
MNSPASTGTPIVLRQAASTVEALSGRADLLPAEPTGDLQTIQSNYETLFNLAPVGYFVIYEDLTIREVNRTAASLLGIPRQDILGNPLIGYAQTRFRDSLLTHFRRVFSGHEESVELGFDNPAGSFPAQLHSVRIQDPSTDRPCCLCSMIDLSGRQNTREELVRHQARLKSLQIEQTKRMAELQDRLLEESTFRRKAQHEARLHCQAVEERSEELARLRQRLTDQAAQQQHTDKHLASLQQHLTRLTQAPLDPPSPSNEPLSPSASFADELPSPEHLHKLHHRLQARIDKLDAAFRRRQTAADPKIRLVLRLLAQSDRLRRLLAEHPQRPASAIPDSRIQCRSIEQSLWINETLLQKTCRLNAVAAWHYDPAVQQWLFCTGLALLMGIRNDGPELDAAAFCAAIVPEDRESLQQLLQSPPQDQPSLVIDHRITRDDGAVRHLRHTVEILRQPDNTARLSAAVVDITAWKKNELRRTRCLHRLQRLGHDQVEWLAAQRDELMLEQTRLLSQLDDLQRQHNVFESRLETQQAELGELRRQNSAEREQNRHLVVQFRKHKDRLAQLVGERTRQIQDIRQSVEIRHKTQLARISELSVQLRESQSLADHRKQQLEDLQQRHVHHHTELQKTIDGLTGQRDQLLLQLDKLSSVESQIREMIQVRDHLFVELNRVRKELEEQAQSAATQTDDFQSRLRSQTEQAEQSNAQWFAQVQSLEIRLAAETRQAQAAQLQLLSDRESFESRIRELTDSLAASRQDIENHRRCTVESQIEHLEQRQSLQSALTEAESKSARLTDELAQLRRQRDALTTQTSDEIDRLKTDLAEARRDQLSTQSECRHLTAESQAARSEGLRQVQQLRHNLDMTHQTVARLQEQVQSQQSQSEQSALALHSDLDTLRSRLAESQADFEAFLPMVRDDIHRLLDQFQTSTDNAELPHLAAQIAELADIAHLLIATGRIEKITNVDMQSLVEGILDSFHDWIDQASVRIELGQLPACCADANLLTRVFVELVDNALKFLTPDRPGQIAITAWTQEHLWLCQIEDNGIGMAPDQIDRAFELGIQLAPNTSGRGLGLAFVRRIVNLHHGRIEVDSQPNHGTRILLVLPLG